MYKTVKTLETENAEVTFEESSELITNVYNKVLEYFVDQGLYCAESLMQDDNHIINSPDLLADIAENLFKFKVKDK